jgi:hypothetical protein
MCPHSSTRAIARVWIPALLCGSSLVAPRVCLAGRANPVNVAASPACWIGVQEAELIQTFGPPDHIEQSSVGQRALRTTTYYRGGRMKNGDLIHFELGADSCVVRVRHEEWWGRPPWAPAQQLWDHREEWIGRRLSELRAFCGPPDHGYEYWLGHPRRVRGGPTILLVRTNTVWSDPSEVVVGIEPLGDW